MDQLTASSTISNLVLVFLLLAPLTYFSHSLALFSLPLYYSTNRLPLSLSLSLSLSLYLYIFFSLSVPPLSLSIYHYLIQSKLLCPPGFLSTITCCSMVCQDTLLYHTYNIGIPREIWNIHHGFPSHFSSPRCLFSLHVRSVSTYR